MFVNYFTYYIQGVPQAVNPLVPDSSQTGTARADRAALRDGVCVPHNGWDAQPAVQACVHFRFGPVHWYVMRHGRPIGSITLPASRGPIRR
jgi:hypothetical protein